MCTASRCTWPRGSWLSPQPGEVLVSGAIPALVLGSRIDFDDRGSHQLKGMPHPWPVFAVRDIPA